MREPSAAASAATVASTMCELSPVGHGEPRTFTFPQQRLLLINVDSDLSAPLLGRH